MGMIKGGERADALKLFGTDFNPRVALRVVEVWN